MKFVTVTAKKNASTITKNLIATHGKEMSGPVDTMIGKDGKKWGAFKGKVDKERRKRIKADAENFHKDWKHLTEKDFRIAFWLPMHEIEVN